MTPYISLSTANQISSQMDADQVSGSLIPDQYGNADTGYYNKSPDGELEMWHNLSGSTVGPNIWTFPVPLVGEVDFVFCQGTVKHNLPRSVGIYDITLNDCKFSVFDLAGTLTDNIVSLYVKGRWFASNAVNPHWILATGIWNDSGSWDDNSVWVD